MECTYKINTDCINCKFFPFRVTPLGWEADIQTGMSFNTFWVQSFQNNILLMGVGVGARGKANSFL